MEIQQNSNSNPMVPEFIDKEDSQYDLNVIKTIRKAVENLSQVERFEKAKKYLEDALHYKAPRLEITQQSQWKFFKAVYAIQTSEIWKFFLNFMSFAFMYIIIMHENGFESEFKSLTTIIYLMLVVDFIGELYHESFDHTRLKSRFSFLFFFKTAVLILLFVDWILIFADQTGKNIPILTIFRAFIPILYNIEIRRSFESLMSAYKDIFVYFIFYLIVILIFAIFSSNMIVLNNNTVIDQYTNNYGDLGKMIYIMYVQGSYDAYPDNQLPAIRSSIFYYAFFIMFIFLNMFLFSSIPGSLIFEKFIETRSKLILIDEIKMQNSLIAAFISLGEVNFQISLKKFISFLLYYYDFRVRYIDSMNHICLKLNPNDHKSIHINEFMQLGRILQENTGLRTPLLKDNEKWIRFRTCLVDNLKLKMLVNSTVFHVVTSLLAIGACINAVLSIYLNIQACETIDNVFCYIFFVELILRVIGNGPQNFYNEKWSLLDISLIISGLVFQMFYYTGKIDNLLRIFRIFRAEYLINLMFKSLSDLLSKCFELNTSLYKDIKQLFQRTILILPIIIKFMTLYLIVYYILGILGMEIFQELSQKPATAAYSSYDEFSNFRTFIETQFYLVQVLTEAGWSSVAYDMAARGSDAFGIIMFFFICCHIIIVIIFATLIKGIIWSTFISVNDKYQQIKKEENQENQVQSKAKVRFEELQFLEATIKKIDFLTQDSSTKRQIYQKRINYEILNRIKKTNKNKKITRNSIKTADKLRLYRNFDTNRILLQDEEEKEKKDNENQQFIMNLLEKFTKTKFIKTFNAIKIIDDYDFEQKIEKLSKKIKIRDEKQLKYEIKNDEVFLAHLHSKIKSLTVLKKTEKNKQNDVKESVSMHIFEMHILLNMRACWREQKICVIKNLIEKNIINQTEAIVLLHKKLSDKNFKFDQNSTIRRMYLQGTDKKLIETFQAEYFADIYGKVFKEINKVTIEPLLKLESTLIYSLKNIFRYPQISSNEFFKILSKIEDKISNDLLMNGSMFKFVFQLNSQKEVWFSINYNTFGQMKINFLKNGIWLYNDKIVENQIYYCEDMFKFSNQMNCGDVIERTKLMKNLYETFESLALSLNDHSFFFESNANYHVYDSFFTFSNVENIQRLIQRQIEISKIMVVLLTKEEERSESNKLDFDLTEINTEKPIDQINFVLDETQSQTFQKLSNLASLNDKEITAREGLPFTYVYDFLVEINDVLKLYSPNFLHQVENVLNSQLQQK